MRFLSLQFSDESVEKVEHGELHEGREDDGEAQDDEDVQGCRIVDLRLADRKKTRDKFSCQSPKFTIEDYNFIKGSDLSIL